MRRATFLASARGDFVELHSYVAGASGSLKVGRTFIAKLRAKCHKLAAIEGTIGRARPDLRPTFAVPSRKLRIFFRYREQRFEVVNIIEGHRDIDSLFASDYRPSK